MHPLALEVRQHGTADENRSHILAALALGLPELQPALCAHDGTFVIVGSGPSLPQFVDEIKGEREKGRPICAIKGTHDFLCERGIEPTLFLSVDPRPRVEHLRCKTENTIYLIASRCHPEIFQRLKGDRIILWHSWADEDEAREIWETRKQKLLIGGGTTSGLRAINVAYMLGFRKFVLYGMDSCLGSDGTKRFNGDLPGQTIDVFVGGPTGRKFLTNHAMAQQASDFQQVYNAMPDVTVEAKGDGLLAAIIEERKQRGMKA